MQTSVGNPAPPEVERVLPFQVDPGLPVFAGHFPGMPLVPAALELEWMLAAIPGSDSDGWVVKLAKFTLPLLPGDSAEIHISRKGAGYSASIRSAKGVHASAVFERMAP